MHRRQTPVVCLDALSSQPFSCGLLLLLLLLLLFSDGAIRPRR